MSTKRTKFTIIITFLLAFVFTSCSSSLSSIPDKNLNAISQEKVTITAINADAYSWSQISGIEVILINADTSTLSFIAPEVQAEETLVFELEAVISSAIGNDVIKKERATVTVHPLEITTENNETNTTTITLKSIKLTIDKTSLNLDENTTLNAVASYSDNTTKDITQEVEWINTDSNALEINKHHLKTKQEKNIILQAKLNAVTSNAVALEIYKEINGHRLPPEPDKTLNDSTLLGIDSNSNGVRDDVERKIYFTYDKKINQKLMMQSAKTNQAMLADPDLIKNAYDWDEPENKNLGCRSYLFRQHNLPFDLNYANFLEDNTYNSKERIRKYMKYNNALSGGVFSMPESDNVEASCDFNVTEALGL